MIPYGTMQEAEAVLGRTMTWAEAAWFRYSAAMPDSWLMCHNAFAFAIVFLVVPLPLILLEQFAPAIALRYKLQPKVRPLPATAHLRNIVVGGRKMLLLYAPHQLMYLITFKVYVYIYSCIYCIIRSL
jgi:hypothetical protein